MRNAPGDAIMPRMVVLIAALALAGPAAAQSNDELIAKAKAEKEVVYYTELIVDQIVRPLASAFERKYGIKVSFWRSDSQAASLRLSIEHKAGRPTADVWSLASALGSLIEGGLIEPFSTENTAALPAEYR